METYNTPRATVVLLMNSQGDICLARKKQAIHTNDGNSVTYSLGMYNGYGGKQEDKDSTIFDTAIRELLEESGVFAHKENLELLARVYFFMIKEGKESLFMDVSFFVLRTWEREPEEGKEMGAPVFFQNANIPYSEMMPADRFIFEKILQNEKGVYKVVLLGKQTPPQIIQLPESISSDSMLLN